MFAKRAPSLSCATSQVLGEQLLLLDKTTINATRYRLGDNGMSARNCPSRRDIIELLNVALATKLVCVLRGQRHHFTAGGLGSPEIVEAFMVRAREEMAHADRLARRIAQLGGEPDFSPDALARRSLADYDGSLDLKTMIRADRAAQRAIIEGCQQMIALVGDRDPATRRLLEELVSDERQHADKLKGWLAD